MAVDPVNSLCKTLATHAHFQDAREWDDGLFYQQYLYAPQTGEFEKTSFA